jgi:hypothetical protein
MELERQFRVKLLVCSTASFVLTFTSLVIAYSLLT